MKCLNLTHATHTIGRAIACSWYIRMMYDYIGGWSSEVIHLLWHAGSPICPGQQLGSGSPTFCCDLLHVLSVTWNGIECVNRDWPSELVNWIWVWVVPTMLCWAVLCCVCLFTWPINRQRTYHVYLQFSHSSVSVSVSICICISICNWNCVCVASRCVCGAKVCKH